MPIIDGILETALYVDDLERSTRFYQAIFGFELIDAGERLHALRIKGKQVLLLCRKGASANLHTRAHDANGRTHLAFAVPVDEVASWENWLHEHGVAVEERHAWERGGVSLYFRDPDQHLLELAAPGVWSIY